MPDFPMYKLQTGKLGSKAKLHTDSGVPVEMNQINET